MSTFVNGSKRTKDLNAGAPNGWVRSAISTREAGLDYFNATKLNAVISTWNDADIIEANVRNCFLNGCSRVFILDNGSSDDSVVKALACGAELGECFHTEYYDDDLRILKQNEIIQRNTSFNMWWACLDADEFICGLGGEKVVESLSRLSPDFSTVGSNAIDLYPTEGCEYNIGDHPANCFAYGMNRKEAKGVYCPRGHYKHVFIRQLGIFDLAQTRGNHYSATPAPKREIFEPEWTLPIFHAPLRRKEDAFSRLEKLCGKQKELQGRSRTAIDDGVTGNNGAQKRWNTLKHVYAGEWDRVEMPHTQLYGRSIIGLALYPWKTLHPELKGLFE